MSVKLVLRCDECGDTAPDFNWANAAELRRDMGEQGWRRRGRGDICARCASKPLIEVLADA
jgi:hypothetical protein